MKNHFFWHPKLLLGSFLLGSVIGFGYAQLFRKKVYLARLTFVLERPDQTKGEGNSVYAVALDRLGKPPPQLLHPDNLRQVLQSDTLLRAVLITPVSELGNLTLAQFIQDSRFPFPTMHGHERDSVLAKLVREIGKTHLLAAKAEEMGSFHYIEVRHPNEMFCLLLPGMLLDKLKTFYGNERERQLRQELAAMEGQIATLGEEERLWARWYSRAKNRSHNMLLAEDFQKLEELEIKVRELAVRRRMLEDLVLQGRWQSQRSPPFLQVIDHPRPPLPFTGKGRGRFALSGGLLASLWTFLFLTFRGSLNSFPV